MSARSFLNGHIGVSKAKARFFISCPAMLQQSCELKGSKRKDFFFILYISSFELCS